ncbi:MAG: winged helix DNA-binding domain-containing protein [Nitriliruptoraceae bacterium]
MTSRRIDDDERRRRIVRRHHLGRAAPDATAVVRSVVAMHSSDPITPYLACWARTAVLSRRDLEADLYETRMLCRLHAMRRTLFVVLADESGDFLAGATQRFLEQDRARVAGWVEAEDVDESADVWLDDVSREALAVLERHGGELTTSELADRVPRLQMPITLGSGKWAQRAPLSSRLLSLLAMDGRIVRTRPVGTWRSSQYRWAASRQWFGRDHDERDPAAARTALARRYLQAYGPATLEDLRWWTGWTKRQTAAALDAVGACTVELDSGLEGFVLDDVECSEQVDAVALLPGLDPTPMGWKQRDFFLGDEHGVLFDRNGNIGPTVWVDGRIVGGWAQRSDGEIVWELLTDVGRERTDRIGERAVELTDWLDGVAVRTRFPSAFEKELAGR